MIALFPFLLCFKWLFELKVVEMIVRPPYECFPGGRHLREGLWYQGGRLPRGDGGEG